MVADCASGKSQHDSANRAHRSHHRSFNYEKQHHALTGSTKSIQNRYVTTSLYDSQVQYYEPAKWVAKLRDKTTGAAPILLKTNMDAGHGGASGRFQRLEEIAFEYAFAIKVAGKM